MEAEEKPKVEKPATEASTQGKKIKPLYIIAPILVVVIIAAGYFLVSSSGQTVAKGDTVSVYYTGMLTNGTVFSSNVGAQPLNFTVGSNQLILGFDQGVVGMKLNQHKVVFVPVNEAYGPVDPNLIISIPRNALGANKTVQDGMYVSESTPTGQEAQGVITSFNATNITVDFNSPLAGQNLVFNITVISIKHG